MIASCNAGIQFQAWRAARSRVRQQRARTIPQERRGRRQAVLDPVALRRPSPAVVDAWYWEDCLFDTGLVWVCASETRSACRGVLSCQIFKDPGPAERAIPAGPYMPSLSNTKVHLLKGCTQLKCHSLPQPVATCLSAFFFYRFFQLDFFPPLFFLRMILSD